jgi:hypothetical protein
MYSSADKSSGNLNQQSANNQKNIQGKIKKERKKKK